jgi:hypothetical protein
MITGETNTAHANFNCNGNDIGFPIALATFGWSDVSIGALLVHPASFGGYPCHFRVGTVYGP